MYGYGSPGYPDPNRPPRRFGRGDDVRNIEPCRKGLELQTMVMVCQFGILNRASELNSINIVFYTTQSMCPRATDVTSLATVL